MTIRNSIYGAIAGVLLLAMCYGLASVCVTTALRNKRAKYERIAKIIAYNGSTAARELAIERASVEIDIANSDIIVRSLIIALKDPVARIRMAAAVTLASWIPQSAIAVPALTEALEDKNVLVRISAAESLGQIVSRANEGMEIALPALTNALYDSEDTVVLRAANSLRLLDQGELAVQSLIKILEKNEPGQENVRILAMQTLVKIGSAERAVQSALLAALHNKSGRIRIESASALASIGARNKLTLTVIAESMQSEDELIKSIATRAFHSLPEP